MTMKKATRDGFGEAVAELGLENNKIYLIDADIGKSCKTDSFKAEKGNEKRSKQKGLCPNLRK